MNKIAFVFPGQGSQSVGMGSDVYNNFDVAKNVFDCADKTLNRSISKICFEGPEEELKKTVNTQPAILTVSIALLEVLKSQTGLTPSFVAGHSLGEYAALYEAGVLSMTDAFSLIQKRAEAMDKVHGGKMAAVLGLSDEKVKEILDSVNSGYVDAANYNCIGQVVITGEEKAIEDASKLLIEAGAKRVIPLAVSGAFHSKLMKGASEEYEKSIENYTINDAKIPVVTNVDAQITTSNFKRKMIEQIYSPVYWTQSVLKMIDEGVDTFIEIGNGKVLTGLIKKINKEVKTFNLYNCETLEAIKGELL
ncbi:MAG: [acyl-carrier-protein] S-malonyltransferase [Candidatus Melainabacteria bacterium]|nr:MAG: [acyl-carrier-protein] S-malonyltransferase [Candidatus Melainabacteria bacterium]